MLRCHHPCALTLTCNLKCELERERINAFPFMPVFACKLNVLTTVTLPAPSPHPSRHPNLNHFHVPVRFPTSLKYPSTPQLEGPTGNVCQFLDNSVLPKFRVRLGLRTGRHASASASAGREYTSEKKWFSVIIERINRCASGQNLNNLLTGRLRLSQY